VEVGFGSECFLREARCLPASSQNGPESSLKGMHG
jgi:hypothetical protein